MSKRILLIEDDRELYEEISEILKDEGYSVDITHDGSEAEMRIESGTYDVILLDLKIPGTNGYEVLKSIRKITPSVKVIIVTGSLSADEAGPDILNAADAVISKPFDIKTLLHKISS